MDVEAQATAAGAGGLADVQAQVTAADVPTLVLVTAADLTSILGKKNACPTFKFMDPRPTIGEGVAAQDERFMIRCAQEIVRAMYEDRDYVQPLYDKYLARKEARQKGASIQDASCFTKKVTVMRSLEEDWTAQFVLERSDMDLEDLMKAKKADPDAPVVYQLLSLSTQLDISRRMPPEMQLKDVAYKVLTKLSEKSGDSLAEFQKFVVDWCRDLVGQALAD